MNDDEKLLEELSPSALGLMAILSENPMTGYQLKKLIDKPEFIYWRDSFGSIYPNLKKITSGGLAEKKRADRNGRKRIVYSLTPRGRRIVNLWLRMPAKKKPVKIELLLKLRFAYPQGEEAVMGLLRDYLDHQKTAIPEIYEGLQYLEGLTDTSLRTETRRINADFWYRFSKMLIEWCEDSMDRIQNRDPR